MNPENNNAYVINPASATISISPHQNYEIFKFFTNGWKNHKKATRQLSAFVKFALSIGEKDGEGFRKKRVDIL